MQHFVKFDTIPDVNNEKNLAWKVASDRLFQLLPKTSRQSYLQPQNFLADLKERNAAIYFPRDMPFDFMRAAGFLNSGIAEHKRGFYQMMADCDFNLVNFTISGKVELKMDKTTELVGEGGVFCVPAFCPCSIRAASNWNCFWFHTPDTPQWRALMGRTASVRKAKFLEEMEFFARRYLAQLKSGKPSAPLLEGYADMLRLHLESEFAVCDGGVPKERRLEAFLIDFQKSKRMKTSLSEAARTLTMSQYDLDKLCLRTRSKKFSKIVLDMRMARCREMLQSKVHAAKIASATGFSSPFALWRAFKSFHGMSPKKFSEGIVSESFPKGKKSPTL